MQTARLKEQYDLLAPDTSEVRRLVRGIHGEVNHFTLPPHAVSLPMTHKSVEEIWYFLSGVGELWRRQGDHDEVVQVGAGVSLDIPIGAHFQFRNTGAEPLRFIIATMPPWPGEQEAAPVRGKWGG